MAFPWPAVISGVASLGSTFFGSKSRKSNLDKQFRQQVDLWHMQNEYNSPLNARKRLEDADFSPGLISGGGAGGNTATSMPAPNPAITGPDPKATMVQTGLNTLAQVVDIQGRQAQIKRDEVAHMQQFGLNEMDGVAKKIANAQNMHELQNYIKYGGNLAEAEMGSAQARKRALDMKNQVDHQFGQVFGENRVILQDMQKEILQGNIDKVRAMKGTERALFDAKLAGILASTELKQYMLENKASIVDPNAPIVDQLITVIANNLFKGAALPAGFDASKVLPNLLEFINPF